MCIMNNCVSDNYCKGYCKKHYNYLHKYGSLYYEPKYKRRGQTKDPLYTTYAGMVSRCSVKSNSAYRKYGAKGIKVCERWLGVDGFDNFKKDMGERPDGYTLDRINPEGNYEPCNCRWATKALQAVNKTKKPQYFRGVSEHSKGGFNAALTVNGISYRKHFVKLEDAVAYRISMEEKMLGRPLCAR